MFSMFSTRKGDLFASPDWLARWFAQTRFWRLGIISGHCHAGLPLATNLDHPAPLSVLFHMRHGLHEIWFCVMPPATLSNHRALLALHPAEYRGTLLSGPICSQFSGSSREVYSTPTVCPSACVWATI